MYTNISCDGSRSRYYIVGFILPAIPLRIAMPKVAIVTPSVKTMTQCLTNF